MTTGGARGTSTDLPYRHQHLWNDAVYILVPGAVIHDASPKTELAT